MIKKNNLGFSGNLFVYQDKNMFSYSVDTIMLGNFFQSIAMFQTS